MVPHIAKSGISLYLTQAIKILQNKAKEVALSVQNTLQKAQPIVHPEMNKARQMVENKNAADKNTAVRVELWPQTKPQMAKAKFKSKQYA